MRHPFSVVICCIASVALWMNLLDNTLGVASFSGKGIDLTLQYIGLRRDSDALGPEPSKVAPSSPRHFPDLGDNHPPQHRTVFSTSAKKMRGLAVRMPSVFFLPKRFLDQASLFGTRAFKIGGLAGLPVHTVIKFLRRPCVPATSGKRCMTRHFRLHAMTAIRLTGDQPQPHTVYCIGDQKRGEEPPPKKSTEPLLYLVGLLTGLWPSMPSKDQLLVQCALLLLAHLPRRKRQWAQWAAWCTLVSSRHRRRRRVRRRCEVKITTNHSAFSFPVFCRRHSRQKQTKEIHTVYVHPVHRLRTDSFQRLDN
jgi:hypothetical protein